MPGKPYPPELREQAKQLAAQGFNPSEISRRLGPSITAIYGWLNPGYAEQTRKRSREAKLRRRRTCPGCGKKIWYTSTTCNACQKERYWTRERIRKAIQLWAATHDNKPPTARQWRKRGENHPASTSVYGYPGSVYRSWNEAITDAGFTPRRSSPGPGNITWDKEEAMRLRDQGIPDSEIARRFGVSASAIWQTLGARRDTHPQPPGKTREARIEALRKALHHQ